jgi:hypothetical protein
MSAIISAIQEDEDYQSIKNKLEKLGFTVSLTSKEKNLNLSDSPQLFSGFYSNTYILNYCLDNLKILNNKSLSEKIFLNCYNGIEIDSDSNEIIINNSDLVELNCNISLSTTITKNVKDLISYSLTLMSLIKFKETSTSYQQQIDLFKEFKDDDEKLGLIHAINNMFELDLKNNTFLVKTLWPTIHKPIDMVEMVAVGIKLKTNINLENTLSKISSIEFNDSYTAKVENTVGHITSILGSLLQSINEHDSDCNDPSCLISKIIKNIEKKKLNVKKVLH